MIRRTIILMAVGLFSGTLFAQNNMPSALDQLAKQCQEVIALNDTINARHNRLNEVKEQLDALTQNWWKTCNEALSSSACDDSNTRISTINELIRLTDKNYENDLYAQLMEAKNNPQKRSLTPVGQHSSASGRVNANQRSKSPKAATPPTEQVTDPIDNSTDNDYLKNGKKGSDGKVENPIKEEQPKEGKSKGKDESSTSPVSQDSKKDNPEVPPTKKDDTGKKDKTKIEESKDSSNRNKTIELMNSKNKNQNK